MVSMFSVYAWNENQCVLKFVEEAIYLSSLSCTYWGKLTNVLDWMHNRPLCEYTLKK